MKTGMKSEKSFCPCVLESINLFSVVKVPFQFLIIAGVTSMMYTSISVFVRI